MADMMQFPNTVEEFMERYKIVDTEQVYTNGAELVPIFRMKQWFDHIIEEDEFKCSERRIVMVEETFVIYVNGTAIARDIPQYMLADLFDAAVRHFSALPEMSIRVEHTKKED